MPSDELVVAIVVDPRVPFAIDTELESMKETDRMSFLERRRCFYFGIGEQDAVRMLVLTG